MRLGGWEDRPASAAQSTSFSRSAASACCLQSAPNVVSQPGGGVVPGALCSLTTACMPQVAIYCGLALLLPLLQSTPTTSKTRKSP